MIPRGLPPPGDVYIHAFGLSALAEADERVLDATERSRAARARAGDHRRRFVIAHVRTREVLGDVLGLAPERVELRAGLRGKPLADGVRFNLTHAGDLALLAVASDRDLGIDLEALRPVADLETFAERVLAPGESQRIAAAPALHREALFYACWTRKEAIAKALGLGLALPLESFAVSLPGDEPARVLEATGPAAPAGSWSLTSLAPRAGYVGALAVRGAPPRVVIWQERA